MISYERLWKTMKEKGVTQYDLIHHHGVSAGQIGRLKKNMYCSTHTVEVFCSILKCTANDILEFIDRDDPAGGV